MTSSNGPSGPPEGPPEPPESPGQRGRRRPPTIELTATEVENAPAAAPEAATPEVRPLGDSDFAAILPDPPPPAPDAPSQDTTGASPSEPPPPPEPEQGRRRAAWGPLDFPWPLAAASAVGVVFTLIALAIAGVFASREVDRPPLEPRLTRVEQQVREIAVRPPAPGVDQASVDNLASRLARLETLAVSPRPAVADPALANRIAILEGEIRALAEKVGVLGRRSDEIASVAGEVRQASEATASAVAELQKSARNAKPEVQRSDIDALSEWIAALEQSAKVLEQTAKALQTELANRPGGDDRSLRLMVLANALRTTVDRDAPFIVELNAAKAAIEDATMLAPLEPFAKTGVPSAEALLRELSALIPALAKAVGTAPRETSFIDRLKSSAERIVRVRPIDEVAGDDPAAIVQRVETRAAQGNLAGALAELSKLPEPARALAKEWVARVQARNAAIEASRRFAADALAALGKPSL